MKLKRKFGLIFYFIPVVIFSILLVLEINMARIEVKSETVAYREKSDITYKVLLKPNTYYEEQFLDEKYNVVSSLIDKFLVNYSYINTFSSNLDYKIKYNVTAELVVYDSNSDEKPIYTKNYTLIQNTETSGSGLIAKVDSLDNDIVYDEYISIVNELKKEVVTDANLIVKFNTFFEGKSDLFEEKIVSNKTSTLTIPVSQKTINVDIKKNGNNKEEMVTSKKKLSKRSLLLIITTIVVLLVFFIQYIIYFVKTKKRLSKYEQELKRILREYDRAITETRGKPRIDKSCNTILVKDFMELLDVHDNLNIPILHYRLNKYMCVFIVRNNNDIYYNVMKSDDYK